MKLPVQLSAAARAAARALASRPVLLTLAFGALYLATFDSEMGSPDEHQRYNLALEIAQRGLGALKDSGSISKYPPLLSLLGAGAMKVGLWLDGGAPGVWTPRLGLSISLFATVALLPLFHWAARELGVPARRAAIAAAIFGITNPLWPYSKRFFSEPLTAMLALGTFAGALAFMRRGSRRSLGLGLICLALLPLNNLIVPVALGLALGWMFLSERRWGALGMLTVASAGSAAVFAVVTWLRFGTLAASGYGNERFTFDILDGLHGLLLGWGRSIFVFAPLLLLSALGLPALWRRSRAVAQGMLVATAASLLMVASWWCWWGGICWGPRLMLPVLPIASLGAAMFFASPGRWRAVIAVPVVAAGLYVQLMGVAFKHDFDIYFWMRDHQDERRSWMEFDRSVVRRMPRHFREHPWDLSSSFLTLEQRGPSVVELDGRPVRRVELIHRGDALIFHWSISDLFAVVREGERVRRVPAGELGARLSAYNGQDTAGALDGDPRTRWSTGSKRLDGMWVRLDFGRIRDDLVRLELEHLPADRDFPNALEARVQADDAVWTPAPARAATPRLVWSRLLFVFTAAGLALGGLALAPRRSERGIERHDEAGESSAAA